MKNVTIAIGRNPLSNQKWILDQIVSLVKSGKSDIFIVNTDSRVSTAVLNALKEYTKDDAEYTRLVAENGVMFHTTETEDLQTLDDAKMNSRSAILANMLFSLPLVKQCRDLARHHVPVFVSATPAMSGKVPAAAHTKFLD
ncbi:hypothetical protein RAY_204 [Erwinia phage vB_EamM_RAY]|jgi:hypothetical protein|uniref:Uncharacterized protein n=6 Tax=Agricanvirus TaxID=1984776 RepID=A0A173GE54_9CAUD|nr:hypothetical protein Ea357_201 [Erwinia phage Ea35-70]YP_009605670.1 hypothetical protein FDH98_gp314 [Erwinia phage vB_EamM_RAY]YP_009606312.1 hypothetical protein FDI00_gp206 [Erwinia phage vB_EamM_Special G]AUG86634.1 hypothetical protein MADMEL_206 [Erwinia phage vB_EamM_MadMel]AUG86957.1 hypothetical protein MORTIMER_209 [Erwinia phage vB_EamM_Mortimer]QBP07311.1 hypothetical protein REBECCA_206 [Erwinia phage Rebecca]AHI60354.1 hypothetical protein Ea357_201 [Erwinia phage Ea35-70]A